MAPGKPLKESKVKQMKQEFLNLDADGDGNISVAELRKVLFSMMGKLKVSEAEINQVLKDIDKDGDGTIDLQEYFANMENTTSKNLIHRALVQRSKSRKAFEKFDKDGSGYVTTEELMEVFEELMGGPVTIQQFENPRCAWFSSISGLITGPHFIHPCSAVPYIPAKNKPGL